MSDTRRDVIVAEFPYGQFGYTEGADDELDGVIAEIGYDEYDEDGNFIREVVTGRIYEAGFKPKEHGGSNMIAPTRLLTKEREVEVDADILKDEQATKDAIAKLVSEACDEFAAEGIKQPSKQTVATRVYNRMCEDGWPPIFAVSVRDRILQQGYGVTRLFCNWQALLNRCVNVKEPETDQIKEQHPIAGSEPDKAAAGKEQEPVTTAGDAKRQAKKQVAIDRHVEAVKQSAFRRWVTVLGRSPFAKKLKLNGYGLLVSLMNYQVGREYVFVNAATVCERFGAHKDTIANKTKQAVKYRIVSRWRIDALSDEDKDHLKELGIYKEFGWLYRINPPEQWNWQLVGGVPNSVKKYLYADDDKSEDV